MILYEFIQISIAFIERVFALILSTLSNTGSQRGKMATIPSLLQLWDSQAAFLLRQKTILEQNLSVKLVPGGQVVMYDMQNKQEVLSRINKVVVSEPRLVVRTLPGIHEYVNEDGSKGRTQAFVAQVEAVPVDPAPGQPWSGAGNVVDGRLALTRAERLEFMTSISLRETSLMIFFLLSKRRVRQCKDILHRYTLWTWPSG